MLRYLTRQAHASIDGFDAIIVSDEFAVDVVVRCVDVRILANFGRGPAATVTVQGLVIAASLRVRVFAGERVYERYQLSGQKNGKSPGCLQASLQDNSTALFDVRRGKDTHHQKY
jgi:hypothetical protein